MFTLSSCSTSAPTAMCRHRLGLLCLLLLGAAQASVGRSGSPKTFKVHIAHVNDGACRGSRASWAGCWGALDGAHLATITPVTPHARSGRHACAARSTPGLCTAVARHGATAQVHSAHSCLQHASGNTYMDRCTRTARMFTCTTAARIQFHHQHPPPTPLTCIHPPLACFSAQPYPGRQQGSGVPLLPRG